MLGLMPVKLGEAILGIISFFFCWAGCKAEEDVKNVDYEACWVWCFCFLFGGVLRWWMARRRTVDAADVAAQTDEEDRPKGQERSLPDKVYVTAYGDRIHATKGCHGLGRRQTELRTLKPGNYCLG